MQIEIFCLCKAAPFNALNQPTLIDVFDVKIAAGEPALIEPFLVAISIRVFKVDEGQHRFSITCKDPSGKVVLGPITEIFSCAKLPRDSITIFQTTAVPAGKVYFGKYEFAIELDGKHHASTYLYIEKQSNR